MDQYIINLERKIINLTMLNSSIQTVISELTGNLTRSQKNDKEVLQQEYDIRAQTIAALQQEVYNYYSKL